jgi:colanic acid biosynthesis glycosyl transferase WcaI
MKVLVIGTLYEPDLGPSAALFTLLSENLVRRGHRVTVITMVPHFPSGQVRADFTGKRIWRSIESDVRVIRIRIPSADRSNLAQRLFQYLCYQIGAIGAGFFEDYDVVLAANPFLTVFLPFVWFVVLRRKPAVYSVQDLYPDVGVRLGVFRGKFVIALATALEGFCLKRARVVQIISDSFRSRLCELGVREDRIVRIYDWVDTDLIRPLPRENAFSEQHDLNGRFVVLYAGNLGFSQGLEHVLTVARQMADHQDILFVFVGEGSALESLKSQASKCQLANVRFIPFQPRCALPEVLASADISLVPLRRGIAQDSLPSKIFSIIASGRPLLASVDQGSAIRDLVELANAGLCVSPEEPPELVDAILRLKQSPELRQCLGRNGREWAEHHHSPQSAAAQFETILLAARSSKKADLV